MGEGGGLAETQDAKTAQAHGPCCELVCVWINQVTYDLCLSAQMRLTHFAHDCVREDDHQRNSDTHARTLTP
jgi:hypothetical protein